MGTKLKDRRTMRRRLFAAGLVAVLGMSNFHNVTASTISEATDKKDEAQQNLDSVNQNISDIESQQSSLQTEIDALDSELVELLVNMDVLSGELTDKEAQLKQVKSDLKDAQADADEQYDAMKTRIRYMYENGDTSLLEAIIGSTSMADMLNRVEYVTSVYDYDRDLLDTYQATVQKVNDLKTQTEQEKAELEEMQAEYQTQEDQLEAMKTEKEGQMSDFTATLAQAQELADQYKATIDQQNTIIQQEQERIAAEKKAQEEAAKKAAAAATVSRNNTGGSVAAPAAGAGGGSNPSYATGVSGGDVVAYACQFVGNPYVWGGTSLTNGADCSGFVMSVFANFGISLPHSSAALQGCGQAVSYENAQPGDLICYSGHVAIYMGGGQIVHAQSAAVGITTGNATYRSIVTVRRVL